MKRPAGFDSDYDADAAQSAAASAAYGPAADVAAKHTDTGPQPQERAAADTQEVVTADLTAAREAVRRGGASGVFFRGRRGDATERDERLAKAREVELSSSVWDTDRRLGDSFATFGEAEFAAVAEEVQRDAAGTAAAPIITERSSLFAGAVASIRRLFRSGAGVRRAKRELTVAKRAKAKSLRRFGRTLTADTRRRLWRGGIVAAVIVGFGALVAAAVFTPAMSVREVKITGASLVPTEQVEAALKPLEGKPLALVSDQDVYAALQDFDLIQRYSVERVPPGQLVVRLTERRPVINVKRGDTYAVLDAAGVQIAAAGEPQPGLPVAETSQVTDSGSKAFAAAGVVLRDMPQELREQIAQVTANSAQDVTFVLRSGLVLRWGDTSDTALKAVIFERMSAALGDRQITVIDVSSTAAPVFE